VSNSAAFLGLVRWKGGPAAGGAGLNNGVTLKYFALRIKTFLAPSAFSVSFRRACVNQKQ
jgi:hypothetical protein